MILISQEDLLRKTNGQWWGPFFVKNSFSDFEDIVILGWPSNIKDLGHPAKQCLGSHNYTSQCNCIVVVHVKKCTSRAHVPKVHTCCTNADLKIVSVLLRVWIWFESTENQNCTHTFVQFLHNQHIVHKKGNQKVNVLSVQFFSPFIFTMVVKGFLCYVIHKNKRLRLKSFSF